MAEDDSRFELIANRNEQVLLARQEAIYFIREIITEVSQMGANDLEVSLLNDLIKSVDEGMDPEIAKQKARNILDSKQDYH